MLRSGALRLGRVWQACHVKLGQVQFRIGMVCQGLKTTKKGSGLYGISTKAFLFMEREFRRVQD